MCVILHGLKKKYVKREDVVQAMKANNAGFFIAILRGTARETLRTLNEDALLKTFDSAGDGDEIVIHARIPSRGTQNLDNVHGWEEDGILFCHNMTLASLDGMMKDCKWEDRTDSEFFFRKLFIPYMRGLGPDAYKNGRFCTELDAFVRHFCGTYNKFAFIMPDNRVLRYGNWTTEDDRKENGEQMFYASNSSYVPPKVSSWKPSKPLPARPYGPASSFFYDDPYYDDREYGYASFGPTPKNDAETARKRGETLRKAVGDAALLRMAIADMMVQNYCALKELDTKSATSFRASPMEVAMPSAFSNATMEAAIDGLPLCVDSEGVELYVEDYAAALAKSLTTCNVSLYEPKEEDYLRGWSVLEGQLETFQKTFPISFDMNASSIDKFVYAVDGPYKNAKGRWAMSEIDISDLVGDGASTIADARKHVNVVLSSARSLAGKAGKGKEGGGK